MATADLMFDIFTGLAIIFILFSVFLAKPSNPAENDGFLDSIRRWVSDPPPLLWLVIAAIFLAEVVSKLIQIAVGRSPSVTSLLLAGVALTFILIFGWLAFSGETSPKDVETAQPDQISKGLLALCAASTIAVCGAIIVVICSQQHIGAPHPIIPGLLLLPITLWISIALADSDEHVVLMVLYFGSIFFTVLSFIAYQTILSFWTTLCVLSSIIVLEHWRRATSDPLYTRLAQVVVVLAVTASALRHFTAVFLPTLQRELHDQYTWLIQVLWLREGILILLGAIIIVATGIKSIEHLRQFQWREYTVPKSTNSVVLALYDLRYFARNGSRFFCLTFVIVLREAIVYVANTLLNPNLLKTVFYSSATAIIAVALVAQAYLIQPFLVEVLQNTAPFFQPSHDLLMAYARIAGIFVLALAEAIVLTWIWLPRSAARSDRRPAWQRFTLTTAAGGVCIWLATTAAWLVNYFYPLHATYFATPGYVMAIIVPFALWATVQASRSGMLWNSVPSSNAA